MTRFGKLKIFEIGNFGSLRNFKVYALILLVVPGTEGRTNTCLSGNNICRAWGAFSSISSLF